MILLDREGVKHELEFWERFVKTDRFNNWCRNEKTPELNQKVYDFIQKEKPATVLDMGSGPVSILNGSINYNLIENFDILGPANVCPIMFTMDPLGKHYEEFVDFKSLGLLPPLPYSAEDIPPSYNRKFRFVHISNALDHCKDPIAAIKNLWNCVIPGGFLCVQGHVNEANFENGKGFHRWNLSVNNKLLMLNAHRTNIHTNLNRLIDPELELYYVNTETLSTDRQWFIWIARKKVV